MAGRRTSRTDARAYAANPQAGETPSTLSKPPILTRRVTSHYAMAKPKPDAPRNSLPCWHGDMVKPPDIPALVVSGMRSSLNMQILGRNARISLLSRQLLRPSLPLRYYRACPVKSHLIGLTSHYRVVNTMRAVIAVLYACCYGH